MILCSNPRSQYLAHKDEIDQAIRAVLDKGWYILGEQVRAFEAEFAAYIGVGHGIGVGSGTEALHLALRACGIGPGDEVITVSHTAVATVAAIELTGATPVLVDIDPVYYTMATDRLASLITPRTKAIIPVHLYGQPVELEPVLALARQHGLRIIEDCAQAHGALYQGRRVGSFGDLSCFSFYPTKNLGALGDGGIIVTDQPDLAQQVRLLREYGWAERYVSHKTGMNSRLDELQAAVLRVKLRSLDEDNMARARIAAVYEANLQNTELTLPAVRQNVNHVYHLYVVRCSRRDELLQCLREQGIAPLIHYPVPVHLQPAYQGRLPGCDDLLETERAAKEVLSLPMYPELSESEIQTVAEVIQVFFKTG